MDQFETILTHFLRRVAPNLPFAVNKTQDGETAVSLNNAFLHALSAGPQAAAARTFLEEMAHSDTWGAAAACYLRGLAQVPQEIEQQAQQDADFARRLGTLAAWLANDPRASNAVLAEQMWSLFFPEGAGVLAERKAAEAALRARRRVTITQLNPQPITDPARQILFTSNVLLTVPAADTDLDALPYSPELKGQVRAAMAEPQLYWFDHPVQIGVEPEANELLYGLRGLNEMIAFAKERGEVPAETKLVCALSVSVTHAGLQQAAKPYLEAEFARSGGLEHLQVYLFTEADTERLLDAVLVPVMEHYLPQQDTAALRQVFGVDGRYGRHYTFLKAIAPLWQLLIDKDVQATFKIDLDQVFPQPALVAEAGASALAMFKTPLWGAAGTDAAGNPVELGMIAGALVNEKDIGRGLFTPDVDYPQSGNLAPDEYIFLSKLPQALSTRAEMMTRYNTPVLDGKTACIQRIHVTGGTNGILIDALRRHRPFTPTFIARAEDQAYIFSVWGKPGARLAYVHRDGLIMRHDKHAFAQEAIKAAATGKLIGDYVRTLLFSAYADMLTGGSVAALKETADPFTGCFISPIPTTIVYLRFALKALSFFIRGQQAAGVDFIKLGAPRMNQTLDFVSGDESALQQQVKQEQRGWQLYYDSLDALAQGILNADEAAAAILAAGKRVVAATAVHQVL